MLRHRAPALGRNVVMAREVPGPKNMAIEQSNAWSEDMKK